MLIADIKGKLSFSHFTGEDFLTSSVFSTFKYLGGDWLEQYLRLALRPTDTGCLEPLDLTVRDPVYLFWPWYTTAPKYGYGAEPDVVILTGNTAVIIEAKNYAGKSGEGVTGAPDEDQDQSEDNAGESELHIADQLGREYFAGVHRLLGLTYSTPAGEQRIEQFCLIFLTRHPAYPDQMIRDTWAAISQIDPASEQESKSRLYWLNWQKVRPILDAIMAAHPPDSFPCQIASDLAAFLERRDLRLFTGFRWLSSQRVSLPAVEDAAPVFYSRQPRPSGWEWLRPEALTLSASQLPLFYSATRSSYWGRFSAFNPAFEVEPAFYREG